jgi:hypothetical protein
MLQFLAQAFSPAKPLARPSGFVVIAPLCMGRKKGSGGRLGNMVELDDSSSTGSSSSSSIVGADDQPERTGERRSKPTRKAKAGAASSSSATASTAGGISPLLAQWAADKKPSNIENDDAEADGSIDDVYRAVKDEALPPRSRDGSTTTARRQRQSQQKEVERERAEMVQQVVNSIDAMLSDDDDDDDNSDKKKKEPFKVEVLLEKVRELLELYSSDAYGINSSSFSNNVRQLTAGSRTTDYRLAWVGSDEAMCHLGTGLHKVKLARLQEVFLTLGPKSRVQMYEVIRILGPFPNIKNTLVGKSAADKPRSGISNRGQPWKITWQSLIDGTGKEILAGSQVRDVDMEVLWCDSSLLVCAAAGIPDNASAGGEHERNDDLLHENGRDLFVFIRESKMESKLDALRVI